MPHAEDLEGLDDTIVLQLAVSAGDLVPYRFDLWHYVLNRWYVADSEEDALDFEALQAVYEEAQLQARLWASWCAVFDLDWSVAGMGSFGEKSIQACFWTLRCDQVTAVLERNDLCGSDYIRATKCISHLLRHPGYIWWSASSSLHVPGGFSRRQGSSPRDIRPAEDLPAVSTPARPVPACPWWHGFTA